MLSSLISRQARRSALGDEIHDCENLLGGEAGDNLTGSNIANVIDGFTGQDIITGLGGADLFIIHDGKTFDIGAPDTITDFVQGEDKIALLIDEVPFTSLIEGTNLLNLVGSPGAASGINGAQLYFDTTSSMLYYDNDGDDLVVPVHIATLSGFAGSLHASDFSLIESIRSY